MELKARIIQFLKQNSIPFTIREHEAASTCEDSARLRGEDLAIGGKTLLFKDKVGFKLFVISAKLQVDSNKVRKILNSSKLRFATAGELMDLCSVEKGALPPLGRPVQDFDLFIDESIKANDKIAFNAGLLTTSIILKTEDYLKVVDGQFCEFSRTDNL
ncbi:YbaK/EbsC family protein [Halobacteriovorax sp. HLS]|uniref:YbaK/EbsC family protein n=1 Tax=Halobacteriovorax sp. HLS TaxID=2234000 RepID=UPI000FD98205|nr:YbaK/EbsC family protein [Halobacteriovorax sp. HLS]